MNAIVKHVLSAETVESLTLQFIGRDDHFWSILPDQGDGATFSACGMRAAECTGYACTIQLMLGAERVNTFGFFSEDNPRSAIAQVAGGHDFVIVDGRFIVDPWITDVEGMHERGVFDLKDPTDLQEIRPHYGDPGRWRSMNPAFAKIYEQHRHQFESTVSFEVSP